MTPSGLRRCRREPRPGLPRDGPDDQEPLTPELDRGALDGGCEVFGGLQVVGNLSKTPHGGGLVGHLQAIVRRCLACRHCDGTAASAARRSLTSGWSWVRGSPRTLLPGARSLGGRSERTTVNTGVNRPGSVTSICKSSNRLPPRLPAADAFRPSFHHLSGSWC